jgi:hypothetical protein
MIRRNDQIGNVIETKTRGKVVAEMIENRDENLIGTCNVARVTHGKILYQDLTRKNKLHG